MGFFDEAQRQATFKRCAHCGSSRAEVKSQEFHDCSSAMVICRKCGMRTRACRFITGDKDSERRAVIEAINAWNKRAKELI